jgi:SSS family transporter
MYPWALDGALYIGGKNVQTLDLIIVVIYMIGIMYLGYALGKSNESEEDYFVAGRSLPWYAIGLSVGVTMISANSFIGGPGWGYYDGILAAMVNITVPISILFITYTVLPVLYNAKVTTVYEYINKRLGGKSRILNVVIWLCQSMIFMGGFVYTPSLVLSQLTPISFEMWVPIIVIFAIIYTAMGGIKAVVWTDAIQAVVLLCGLIFAIFYACSSTPMTYGEIMGVAKETGKLISFDMAFDKSSLNVWTVLIGGFSMWVGYFGFDQGQVQRYLTAKNITNIKKGGIMSSVAMQLIYWACMFLGVILFVFYQNNPSTLDFANSNNVMIDFLANYVPTGLLGLLLAATFAAAMSSVDSILNSLTAVFTKDIYEPYISKQENTPLSKTITFSVVFGLLITGFVYLGLGDNTKSILDTIGGLVAPFGALLTGLMFACIFMPRVNDNGAFIGSLIAAIASFATGNVFPAHWLWAYFYGAVYCVIAVYVCSLFFKDESAEKRQYTVFGALEAMKGQTDEEGTATAPLVMDKYGWIMLAVFVVQCVFLLIVQM